jgi:hypothetical protein
MATRKISIGPTGNTTTSESLQSAFAKINSNFVDVDSLIANVNDLKVSRSQRTTPYTKLGFVGDGASHPLSATFPTLAAAQAIFPRAASLSEEIDGHAIQRDLDLQAAANNGRALIDLSAGTIRINRTIDVTGINATIRGAALGGTLIQIDAPGASVAIQQGSATAGQGQPLSLENLTFENISADKSASQGFYIRHNANAGILQALMFRNVTFHYFEGNTIYNVGRGLDFNNVVIAGPDFVKQPRGGITVLGTSEAAYGMFSHRYYNCLVSNYRWGWDYQIASCAVEGQSFISCAAYNGDGIVNVNCNGLYPNGASGYKALLWSFDNCDWEGLAYAIHMLNCRNVRINNGFYIYHEAYKTNIDRLYYFNNSALPQGWERAMFNFENCIDVMLDKVEMAAGDINGSCLINIGTDCEQIVIKDSIVRCYSPGNAGFRLQGAYENACIEKGTKWASWDGGTPKIAYSNTGDKARQISYTDASSKFGTVDDSGFYQFFGTGIYSTGSDGVGTVALPLRADGNPFFKVGPTVVMTQENSGAYTGTGSVKVRVPTGFSFYASGAAANINVAINWQAAGR